MAAVDSASAEITKVQELVYELRVEQVMNRDVISISPNCSMRELEEVLRIKRISGVPVIENGAMIGIISLEDLIRALGEGAGLAPVRERMNTNIQVVRPDEPVVSAVQLFARYGYGRFPVVSERGELLGILTKGDIIRGLLRQLEQQWQREEDRRHRASHLYEGIESDDTVLILRYHVAAQDFTPRRRGFQQDQARAGMAGGGSSCHSPGGCGLLRGRSQHHDPQPGRRVGRRGAHG